MRETAVETRCFHCTSACGSSLHFISPLENCSAVVFKTGWAPDPIHVIHDFPALVPTTTCGMTRTETSSGEKEKDENKTGPVPLP